MKKLAQAVMLLLCVIAAASCQQSVSDDITSQEDDKTINNVTINIAQIEQIPFSTPTNTVRASDVTEVCSHIYYAVYTSDGTRKISKSQSSAESGFGRLTVPLDNGTYRVVVLAYNSNDNPTATNPEKITFGNNGKMSDTFLWSEEITVNGSMQKDVTLKRAVAMFRLITTDNIPSNVAKMKFNYTGGSSSINAVTGVGCVNSRQEEAVTVTETGKPGTFEVYTFPRDDGNTLKMEVTALDASGTSIATKTFEDVPVTRNKITQYKGKFFDGGSGDSGNITFQITVDDEWEDVIEEQF